MHTIWASLVRMWRWFWWLGREVRVHKHRGHPTTQYLSTRPEDFP